MFAKIFDLEEGDQLLMTKETDNNEPDKKEQLCFLFRGEKSGASKAITLGYKTKEIRDHVFDSVTLEMAMLFYKTTP